MNRYGKISVGILAVWFATVLIASAGHGFENGSGRFGLGVAVAALVPLVVFSVWMAGSRGFREFAFSLNPKILTTLHTWRIMGFTFVLLEARNVLPAIFALPAGYGDMAIGATASLVAWRLGEPKHRNSFIVWQLLGMADLITAVSLGTTAGLLSPQGPSMGPLTVLPLSLIPTFLVPLFIMLHVICIAQARNWKAAPQARHQAAAPLQHSAV